MNGQVYERLTRRDRQLKIVPGLATEWQQVVAADLALQAAPGREVPRRLAAHRRRRRLSRSMRAPGCRPRRSTTTRPALGTPKKVDESDGRVHARRRSNPIFLRAPRHALDHEQGLEREAQGHPAARLQEQGRELRRAQRQRHRPLHAGQPRAWHQDDATSATRTAGARSTATCRRSSSRRSPTTRRGWRRWSRARSTSCSTRPPRDIARLRNTAGVKVIDGPENRDRLHRHGPGPRRTAVQQRQGQEPVQGRARAPARCTRRSTSRR